ncbi:hypothetical protein OF83DRAFT_1180134 [Amylostereum chailletii]|nr:hypothetical protein OF83DRAFT_1180134 [Amylostereum chailletii]
MTLEDPQKYTLRRRPQASQWPGAHQLPRRRRASTGSWEADDSPYSDHRERYHLLRFQGQFSHPISLRKYNVVELPQTLQDLHYGGWEPRVARGRDARLKTFIRHPWPSIVTLKDDATADTSEKSSVEGSSTDPQKTLGSSPAPASPGPSPSPSPPAPIQSKSAPPPSPHRNSVPPVLDCYIPKTHLPDILVVHGGDAMAEHANDNELIHRYLASNPIKFARRYPKPKHTSSASAEEDALRYHGGRVATLDFGRERQIGEGSHSYAYTAPIKFSHLALPGSNDEGEATVVCKLANNDATDRKQLRTEAKIYQTFSRDLQEDVCTYDPAKPTVPPVVSPAVVPKFYGYYEPVVYEDDALLDGITDESRQRLKSALVSLSPILLLEECGHSMDMRQYRSSLEKWNAISSLVLRSHAEKYIHHSLATRNVVGQPGPRSLPPDCRRQCTSSFRIIDFGRATSWQWEEEAHPDLDPRALRNHIVELVKYHLRWGIRDLGLWYAY